MAANEVNNINFGRKFILGDRIFRKLKRTKQILRAHADETSKDLINSHSIRLIESNYN